jgi:hypothetical protein
MQNLELNVRSCPMSRYAPVLLIVLLVTALLPMLTSAWQVTLSAPHLGYGLNVWDQPDLAPAIGFEWVKISEDAYPTLPASRWPVHVLYRVYMDGSKIDPISHTPRPEFLQHISDLVRAGRGKVEAYEIGNEPNLRGAGFWGDYDTDVEGYARLMCAAYPIIKSQDPNAIVVTGGLAPVGRWPQGSIDVVDERFFAMRMFDWMMALNNGQMCADAFGYHPYGFKYEPERPLDQLDPADNGNGFAFRGAEVMHDIMVQHGAGNLPMWATEFGWIRDPGADPWTFNLTYADYSFCNEIVNHPEMAGFLWMEVTQQQQADYLVRAFQYADANWPWMGPMFVWNLDFYHRGTSCTPHKFYSLYRAAEGVINQRTSAPAFTALTDMPRRSAWTIPAMIISPDHILFVGAQDEPRTLTSTVSIQPGGTIPFTWTVSLDPAMPVSLTVVPISGTAPATLTISADASLFAVTGSFNYTLTIAADPTTTLGSPFTLPVTLRVIDHFERTYLPLIARDYAAPVPQPVITPTTRFGAVFITSAEAPADEERYQKALAIGLGMDRWPLYWPGVETSPGNFVWNTAPHEVDRAVISDTAHGIQPLLILMNTPDFYATAGNRALPMPRVGQSLEMQAQGVGMHGPASVSAAGSPPTGLNNSVFSDGTDVPGITKTINTNNPWARFVYEAVNRYRPGGLLAQQLGWPAERGVRNWEIWNEEDYTGFWIGAYTDYARLLKVAYLAAKHADPQARVIYGGLANINPNSTWLPDTLSVINTWPDKDANGWFFDAVAQHNYVNSYNTWLYLYRATVALNTYTITNKSMWVTESNVWLCEDGDITPPCVSGGSPVPLRANLDEQAAFVVQSATYATWRNLVTPIDGIFHFLMYDDCADPLTGPDGESWWGGLGLIRNPAGKGCFSNWLPGQPRPAYDAFKTTIAQLRDAAPKWRVTSPTRQEVISFYRASSQERVVALWARSYLTQTAVLTATGTTAQLVGPTGTTVTIAPANGVYSITLPAATNYAATTPDGSAPIGGRPYFLVEPDPSGTGGPKP